jgi:hypothetical protein
MAHFNIRIQVDENGNFTYTPSFLRARLGDTITFTCDDQFEVMFKDRSPGDRFFFSEQDATLQLPPMDAAISTQVVGMYHFAAAVYSHRAKRVFLDSGCGDIGVGK